MKLFVYYISFYREGGGEVLQRLGFGKRVQLQKKDNNIRKVNF